MKKIIDDLVIDFLTFNNINRDEYAIHEINIPNYSQASVGAALRRLTQSKKTYCVRAEGKKFKVWGLVPQSDYIFTVS